MKNSIFFRLFPFLFCSGILFGGCKSSLTNAESASAKEVPVSARSPTETSNSTIPKAPPKSEVLLDHQYFKISYNEDHRLPNWVSYQLLAKNLRNSKAKGKVPHFSDMALIKMYTPYAKPQDFDPTLYDWGAMAPAEDFLWNQDAHDTTFVMSNITPQIKKLHRGAWKPLENKVRKWACTEGSLKIISGPLLDKSLKKFMTKVSIPKKFFKIIIDETPPHKAIAFILDQEDAKFLAEQKAVSVAEAEKQAGFQFLAESGLPKQEYMKIRMVFKLTDWVEKDCAPKAGAR